MKLGRVHLLPAPTPAELRMLQAQLALTSAAAADAFWVGSPRRWQEYVAGDRRMDAARWTLGLLALGLHPSLRLVERYETPPAVENQGHPPTVENQGENP